MRSLQAFTNEVDDIDMAVSELNAGIDTSLFLKNTCGIIFCSSCAARYCLLVADKNAEGRAYEGRLPENINVQGVYICGEFCPAHGKHHDRLYNVLSNETFTILAI